jgi:hypothetical protein
METPLSGSHLGPHCKRTTRSVQQDRLQRSSLFLVHVLLRRLLLLHPQFATETSDHEYKYSLPRRGSPFKGLGVTVRVVGFEAAEPCRATSDKW